MQYSSGFGNEFYNNQSFFGVTFKRHLSYKFNPGHFGFQATISPFWSENITTIIAGLNISYNVFSFDGTTIFLYQGNEYYYYKYNSLDFPSLNQDVKSYNPLIGLGFEVVALKRLGFNLMFGYSLYNNFSELRRKGEIGLFYKF